MPVLFLYPLAAFAGALLLVRLVVPALRRMNVLDVTEDRVQTCIHAPTPRGAGWGVTPVIALLWLNLLRPFPDPAEQIAAATGAALLLFVPLSWLSWLDDKRVQGLRVRTRFLLQGVAVAIPVLLLPADTTVCLGYLPLWLDRLVTILGWWWFMNLFNFMDGINGISGVQAATIGLGVFLCAHFIEGDVTLSLQALVLLGAACGWLVWNGRRNALAFLGDVGSIGLGYLGGWLLILLATKGHFWPAALISLYYCTDATVTLILKIRRGVPAWQAERAHFYHAGTVPGALSAMQAIRRLLALNVFLLVLAFLAGRYESGWAYLPVGLLACAVLMRHFKMWEKRAQHSGNAA